MSSNGQNLAAGLPHDIRGLLPYQTPWWHYALAGLGAVLAAGLLAWVLWYLLKKRRPKVGKERPVDPWDALESRLGGMLPPGEFTRGPVQENYFYSLSLLLREAVELRTAVRATDLTLYELRSPLRRTLPFKQEDIESVVSFLERADMVKFAGAPSQREEALGDHSRVQAWVRELRPRPQSAVGEPGVAGGVIFTRDKSVRAAPRSRSVDGANVAPPTGPDRSPIDPSSTEPSSTDPSRGRGVR